MKNGLQTQLGSSRKGDPSLMLKLCNKKMVYLFDCGETNFTNSQFKQVDYVFISHTHIDHFIGFDKILRVNLTDNKEIVILGPPGIARNVEGKLMGYTWNITDRLQLRLKVGELYSPLKHYYRFFSQDGFVRRETNEEVCSETPIDDEDVTLATARLDHKIPSIGYSLTEKQFYNVKKDALETKGLRPGPWLGKLKARVGSDEPIDVSETLLVDGVAHSIASLRDELLQPKKQMKVTYVTDVLFSPSNREHIVRLARGSDLFYCETYFKKEDKQRADDAFHLTTEQTVQLALDAGVKKLVPMHISRRYQDTASVLKEVDEAFAAHETALLP